MDFEPNQFEELSDPEMEDAKNPSSSTKVKSIALAGGLILVLIIGFIVLGNRDTKPNTKPQTPPLIVQPEPEPEPEPIPEVIPNEEEPGEPEEAVGLESIGEQPDNVQSALIVGKDITTNKNGFIQTYLTLKLGAEEFEIPVASYLYYQTDIGDMVTINMRYTKDNEAWTIYGIKLPDKDTK